VNERIRGRTLCARLASGGSGRGLLHLPAGAKGQKFEGVEPKGCIRQPFRSVNASAVRLLGAICPRPRTSTMSPITSACGMGRGVAVPSGVRHECQLPLRQRAGSRQSIARPSDTQDSSFNGIIPAGWRGLPVRTRKSVKLAKTSRQVCGMTGHIMTVRLSGRTTSAMCVNAWFSKSLTICSAFRTCADQEYSRPINRSISLSVSYRCFVLRSEQNMSTNPLW
jgi:hypothetical protein